MKLASIIKKIKSKIRLITYPLKKLYLRCLLRGKEPIFILGCEHSGTSIMLSILSNHNEIYALTNETGIFSQKYLNLTQLLFFIKQAGRNRLLEKTPKHVHHIPKIISVFPKAQIIVMIRDGRDVACSIKERTGDIDLGIKKWIESNEAWLIHKNNPALYTLKLESLIANKKLEINKLICFLGLSESKSIFEYHTTKKKFFDNHHANTDSEKKHLELRNWQINQPLFNNTTRWKKEMAESEKELFKQRANYLLKYFNYIQNDEW
jgi:cell division protein FtsL